jgi:hypothetical protein
MIIDDEIIKQSLEWQHRYLTKQCTLDEALAMVMLMGAPIPEHLVRAYQDAITAYTENGAVKDLAELVAHPMTTREKQAFNKTQNQAKIHNMVKNYSETGYNLINPNDKALREKCSPNAFIKVGEDLGLSEHTVYREYNRELKRINPKLKAEILKT